MWLGQALIGLGAAVAGSEPTTFPSRKETWNLSALSWLPSSDPLVSEVAEVHAPPGSDGGLTAKPFSPYREQQGCGSSSPGSSSPRQWLSQLR